VNVQSKFLVSSSLSLSLKPLKDAKQMCKKSLNKLINYQMSNEVFSGGGGRVVGLKGSKVREKLRGRWEINWGSYWKLERPQLVKNQWIPCKWLRDRLKFTSEHPTKSTESQSRTLLGRRYENGIPL
jgi:hypothetical protein